MIIGIDFDGVCVLHDYPFMGQDVPDAEDSLRFLMFGGHKLILNTMRSGRELSNAVQWFSERSIGLNGIQYSPGQTDWSSSPKCYAHLYIDDCGLGIPLIYPEVGRPYVDWKKSMLMIKDLKVVETEIIRKQKCV